MKTAIIAVVIAIMLLGASSSANADIVELPELVGLFDADSSPKTASFDFGTSFLSIDQVRTQMSGTFTLGLAHGDGVNIPVDVWHDVYPSITIHMEPGPGICGSSLGLLESPFVSEEPLNLLLGATWDFLLDGKDEVQASWAHTTVLEEWVIVTLPTVQVSEAHLIIEGVVPEPATVLLFGLGGLLLRTRR